MASLDLFGPGLPQKHCVLKSLPPDSCASCDGLPHLLEELLNDCFKHAIDKLLLLPERSECVEKFHQYVSDLHCHENLLFIIEICRYRYYFEKSSEREKPESQKHLSSSYVNHSLERLIQTLPTPTAPKRRKSSHSQSNSSLSGAPFDLEFDDILNDKAWDYLSNQYVQDSDSDSDLEPYDDTSMVQDQWEYILDNFIFDKSPCQVNLTNQTFRAILELAAFKGQIHHPLELLVAYCEVVDLLHGNVYDSFLKSIKTCPVVDAASVKSLKSACKTVVGSAPLSVGLYTGTNTMCRDGPIVAPVPSKRRSKFLHTFSSSSSSDVSPAPSTLGTLLVHLKSHGNSRVAHSAPQSPLSHPPHSREASPTFKVDDVNLIPRSRSTIPEESHHSSSFMNKLWKKKSSHHSK